jgi:hypothetical protein
MRNDLINESVEIFERCFNPENFPKKLLPFSKVMSNDYGVDTKLSPLFPQEGLLFITQQVGKQGSDSRHAHHHVFGSVEMPEGFVRAAMMLDNQINVYPNTAYSHLVAQGSNGITEFYDEGKYLSHPISPNWSDVIPQPLSSAYSVFGFFDACNDFRFGSPAHPWIKVEKITKNADGTLNIQPVEPTSLFQNLVMSGALSSDESLAAYIQLNLPSTEK